MGVVDFEIRSNHDYKRRMCVLFWQIILRRNIGILRGCSVSVCVCDVSNTPNNVGRYMRKHAYLQKNPSHMGLPQIGEPKMPAFVLVSLNTTSKRVLAHKESKSVLLIVSGGTNERNGQDGY